MFQISQIMYIDSKTSNQFFLHPYIWDTQIKGYKTFFIQLDSGTNTNLIGLKMAYQLIVSNLINFICPNLQGLLTDVKNK